MTHAQLEKYVADEATVAALRERVTAGRVEEYFAAHRAGFDGARIARIEFADEQSARRTIEQIRTGTLDFYAAAERRFLEAPKQPEPPSPLFVTVRRDELPAESAGAIFGVAPGDVVGPLRTESGYAVVRVLDLKPARLDEPAHRTVAQHLFAEWLDERRRTATIEWNWGSAGRELIAERPVA
jgi:putative peptide maturation system protein